MRYSTALTLAVTGLATATPTKRASDPRFPPGAVWDILLEKGTHTLDELKKAAGTIIDIDLYDNTKNGDNWIKELAKTKTVICYFSAGSREDWRDDKDRWNKEDYGAQLMKDENEPWVGENWANVKSDNVKKIMTDRLEFAKKSGCHAVDPDNVDGFQDNQDGFGYKQKDYENYVNWIAKVAQEKGMAVGLKNALDLIPAVVDNVQFAVNEQCHDPKYNECGQYKEFTKRNLAVFNIEYGGSNCDEPKGVNLSEVIKPADQGLSTLNGQCPEK